MEKHFRNINAITVIELNKILDALVENDGYEIQMGDIRIIYQGLVEDTIGGKRQGFQIVRKVKW